jgi:hypothetical protein
MTTLTPAREVVFTYEDGSERAYSAYSPPADGEPIKKRVVDVTIEIPVQTQQGQPIETVERCFEAVVPRTKTAQFVHYKATLTYGRQSYPLTIEIPCDQEFAGGRFRMKFAPVKVKPREVRDIVRDASGAPIRSELY